MVSPPRNNALVAMCICASNVVARNARYMAAKGCVGPVGSRTVGFEGGVLGEEL